MSSFLQVIVALLYERSVACAGLAVAPMATGQTEDEALVQAKDGVSLVVTAVSERCLGVRRKQTSERQCLAGCWQPAWTNVLNVTESAGKPRFDEARVVGRLLV